MRLAPVLLCCLLAACASAEQRAENTASYIDANYGPVCERLGYARGTDAHRNCMVSMFNGDRAQMADSARWNMFPWYECGPMRWR